MIEGERLRLHKGSCCRMKDCPDEFKDKICSVAGFQKPPSVKGWQVRIQGSDSMSTVPEASLALSFHLVPASLARLTKYAQVDEASQEGGLVAAQDIKARHPIFVEPPLIVVGEDQSKESAPFEAHESRWLAYKALLMQSGRGGAWKDALAAFESLTTPEKAPAYVRAAAKRIAIKEGADEDDVNAGDSDVADRVTDVLMKFKCSQFDFSRQTSTDLDAPEFATAAIYARASRLQRSPTPNVVATFKERVCRESGEPFELEADGGLLVVSALRDIQAGEILTFKEPARIAAAAEEASVPDFEAPAASATPTAESAATPTADALASPSPMSGDEEVRSQRQRQMAMLAAAVAVAAVAVALVARRRLV